MALGVCRARVAYQRCTAHVLCSTERLSAQSSLFVDLGSSHDLATVRRILQMQPGHAEIVGAGFGGLVAAIALSKHGWTVRVHERRDSLRGEGYGIAIHNNMARIFAAFGILNRVLAGGMKIDRRDSVDASGRVVMTRARTPERSDR
jgi:heterodisulfide reductase subunit A-like polyferredoxin